MSESRSESKLLKQVESTRHIIKTKENTNNLAVGQEIERPHRHEIMTLYSDFDRLCEECNFLLYVN